MSENEINELLDEYIGQPINDDTIENINNALGTALRDMQDDGFDISNIRTEIANSAINVDIDMISTTGHANLQVDPLVITETESQIIGMVGWNDTSVNNAFTISNGNSTFKFDMNGDMTSPEGRIANIFDMLDDIESLKAKVDILMELLPKRLGNRILKNKNKL